MRASSGEARATLEDALYRQMLLDELNVRELALLEDGSDVIRPVFNVNFRTLGPKLGAVKIAAADFGGGPHRSQVLTLQSRL